MQEERKIILRGLGDGYSPGDLLRVIFEEKKKRKKRRALK